MDQPALKTRREYITSIIARCWLPYIRE